jgi:hypothetical protein
MFEQFLKNPAQRQVYRSALITGASRGIGAALARRLDPSTALLLTGRDKSALDQVVRDLGNGARRIDTIVADLTTEAGRLEVVRRGQAAGLDLLIANAGAGLYGGFLDAPARDHLAAIDVNVGATVALVHALVPGMIMRARSANTRAGVITLASTAAFAPVPNFAVYAASKAFVLTLTEALAAELASEPIDILCACPGATRTDFGKSAKFPGGEIPGAVDAERVAEAILSALGRQRTAIIDPIAAPVLIPVALARAGVAEVVRRGVEALAARRSN